LFSYGSARPPAPGQQNRGAQRIRFRRFPKSTAGQWRIGSGHLGRVLGGI